MSDGMMPEGSPAVIELPAILDIKAAGLLHGLLWGYRGGSVVLDGSGVQRLGGQCLQVLLAARLAWGSAGHGFEVVSLSAAFADGLAMLGFTSAALAAGDGMQ